MIPEQTEPRWTNIVGSRRIFLNRRVEPKLHRIAEVIQGEQLSSRTLARRMQMTEAEVLASVDSSNDLKISELHRWQKALQVPIAELLVEADASLSDPVKRRAQLIRAMRTVRSIQESAEQESVQRMTLQLVEQLLEMMPELEEVHPWPAIGQRRTLDEMGAIVDRCIPAQLLQSPLGDMTDY